MRPHLPILGITMAWTLAACDPAGNLPVPDPAALSEPGINRSSGTGPPGAAPGTCWGKQTAPAVVETVTEQVMVRPEQVSEDGTVTAPAVYRTETVQRIVRERRETWFQTPCDDITTPDFIASLQRALSARGLYRGRITGDMSAATRAAIRRFQAPQGIDSGILSMRAARQLGLVVAGDEDSPEG